jgi:aspartyl protease family protein
MPGTERCARAPRLPRALGAALLAMVLTVAVADAGAQSVELTGLMGGRALVVIDGSAPVVLAAGETRQGVTLVSVGEDSAVIEINGQRQSLRVGANPVSVAGKGSGASRVVLHAGSGGHYYTTGKINGLTVGFVVDTGASDVVIGRALADQLGLNYRAGGRETVVTANGTTQAYGIGLDSVQVGDVAIYNVRASVVPMGMPVVLLGNSFLSHFQMKQENDQMVLEKRY